MKNRTLLILPLMAASILTTACGGGGGGGDSTKTQIGIFNWAGGYGTEWLSSLAEKFEEDNKEVSFEEGKKGVQFTLVQEKEHQDSVQKIKGLTSIDIVFDEDIKYNMWTKSECFKDLTDIVTSESPYDGKKIVDKMSEEQKSAYLKDGSYYAIPSYSGTYGITYNKDLMNSDSLYFKQGGGFTNFAGNKTVGPDGIAGTYDDGLPSTKEEFLKLCKQAKTKNRVPVIASGACADYYVSAFLNNYAATWEGADIANGRLTCTANGVTVLDLNDPTKRSTVDVTTANGYELMRSEGLYEGFDLIEQLFKTNYMIDWDDSHSTVFNSSITNLAAQKYFIEGCHNGKQALMLFEGTWWFNEAHESLVKKYSGDLTKANYGWMPLPTKESNTESTYYEALGACGYVRKDVAESKMGAIKKFLQFACSDESLRNFTKETNTRWNLNYSLTEEDKSALLPFGSELMDFYGSSKTKMLTTTSQNAFFIKNEGSLSVSHFNYIKISNSKNIINYLYDDGKMSKTAADYLGELYNVWRNKGIWE